MHPKKKCKKKKTNQPKHTCAQKKERKNKII